MIISRPGFPDRHVVDGFEDLCTDDVGAEAFRMLRSLYTNGEIEDTAANRAKMKQDIDRLYRRLLFDGRLFRKDGEKLFI